MLNKSIIMGRLTADPELRQTQNGIYTCQFNVAVERNYAGKGQDKQTDFIPVTAWRRTAEFVSRYFSKGSLIIVEGWIQSRTYNDKRYPEVKHYVTEIVADAVYFSGEKNSRYTPAARGEDVVPALTSGGGDVMPPDTDLSGFEEVIGDGDFPI